MRLFNFTLPSRKRLPFEDRRLITNDNIPLNAMEFEIKGILMVIQHFIDNRRSYEMLESCRAANALEYPGNFAIQYVDDLNHSLAYFEYHAEAARLGKWSNRWKFTK